MTETSAAPGRRPIVPFLRLPDDGEPHLVGQRCPACGATYLGHRIACSKCGGRGPFAYVVGVVDLPEGVSVRCNLIDVEPRPDAIRFGMPVEMTTGVSQQDKQGNDVVAFYFRPVQDA